MVTETAESQSSPRLTGAGRVSCDQVCFKSGLSEHVWSPRLCLSKPLTSSASKGENVQVARGWDFSFSDVPCEQEEQCLSWLASLEDFSVQKPLGVGQTGLKSPEY